MKSDMHPSFPWIWTSRTFTTSFPCNGPLLCCPVTVVPQFGQNFIVLAISYWEARTMGRKGAYFDTGSRR